MARPWIGVNDWGQLSLIHLSGVEFMNMLKPVSINIGNTLSELLATFRSMSLAKLYFLQHIEHGPTTNPEKLPGLLLKQHTLSNIQARCHPPKQPIDLKLFKWEYRQQGVSPTFNIYYPYI